MMLDGTHPTYSDTTGSEKMLYIDIQRLIIQGDNFNDEDKLILIYDMRKFNICGNNDTIKYYMYSKAVIRSMEIESAYGAHHRIHSAIDYDTTNRISHYPVISTNHIIKITIQLLEKYGLNQGVDFKVPSNSWVRLKFMSNNRQQRTSG